MLRSLARCIEGSLIPGSHHMLAKGRRLHNRGATRVLGSTGRACLGQWLDQPSSRLESHSHVEHLSQIGLGCNTLEAGQSSKITASFNTVWIGMVPTGTLSQLLPYIRLLWGY
jgi:hypothetical protein